MINVNISVHQAVEMGKAGGQNKSKQRLINNPVLESWTDL